ncbi:hypothetical protein chiPu_0022056 [Chiloscyllium punctatum]|uniref:Core shell protein Gag P30 domain-containing protein n=1 Tax=Chiloscyllium punctatum TaxID=137246 RepID=A0A401RIU5_CHIPU|nr:hypothetical protein [Chiloscyllium punctatum]
MCILNVLFTGEERGLIPGAAIKIWDRKIPNGDRDTGQGESEFPLRDTQWENQNPEHREEIMELKDLILKGITGAVPKSQNLTKAFEVKEEKDETSSAFLQRLRDSMREYSGMNPEDPTAQGLLKVYFVTKAWPDTEKDTEDRREE